MKSRLILTVIALTFLLPSFADEWDDFSAAAQSWDGQKSITNSEFEKAIEALEAPKKMKEAKQKKKKIKKISGGGTSLHNALEPESEIKQQSPIDIPQEETVLNLPVEIYLENGERLEKGFYKVLAQKEKDSQVYMYFYQSQFLKGKIKAIETDDDFDEDTINFVNVIFKNHNVARIIYGSIDLNAYADVFYE